MDSILSNAIRPSNVEIITAVDSDDPALGDYEKIKCVRQMVFEASQAQLVDYFNQMVIETNGDILWPMCDDCEVMTRGWDDIARELLADSPPIWFGDVWDSTRHTTMEHGGFACMPMLPRSVHGLLSYLYNPIYTGTSHDRWLHWTFRHAMAPIIDMQAIRIFHHHVTNDDTHNRHKMRFGRVNSASDIYRVDADKLEKAIEQ